MTQTSVRVILITEQMFGVLIMMMTNLSTYKSIYNDTVKIEPVKQKKVLSGKGFYKKVVMSTVILMILFTCFKLIGTNATTNSSAEPQAGEQVIVVQSGDTLWSIAKQYIDESDDVRYMIFKIQSRNVLQSSHIVPGQKLIIPKLKS